MTDLSFSLPDDLAGPLKLRLAEGQYADAAWVREMIAEGETSGYLDADPSAIIEEIIAERHARRG